MIDSVNRNDVRMNHSEISITEKDTYEKRKS
ncbi:MAG: hypothetical protein FD155_1136 [Bacteroidetes bacterium]|nr:MAG: hypothetical protein FD155_1136 [Bacteroidota bacterium]